jgi:spore coat protein U-like protein
MKRRSFLATLFAAPSVAAVAIASKEPVAVTSAVEPVALDSELSTSDAEIGSITAGTINFGNGRVIITETGIFVRS